MKSTITTPQAAFAYLGLPFALPDVSMLPEQYRAALLATYQLYIITEARNKEANEGKPWVPVHDGSQWHYWPYFWLDNEDGSGFSFASCVFGILCSPVGSRLEFISSDVCRDAAETFIDLYRDAVTLMPQLQAPAAESEE